MGVPGKVSGGDPIGGGGGGGLLLLKRNDAVMSLTSSESTNCTCEVLLLPSLVLILDAVRLCSVAGGMVPR